MKRAIIAAAIGLLPVVAAVAVGTAILSGDPGPGPIPECFGETATAVLVKWEGSRAASRAPYQEWIDAGVDVQANEDNLLIGTPGHDVLVALVETNAGGIVGAPAPNSRPYATAGDSACSFLKHADDVWYMTKGRGDKVLDAGGSDLYFMGGCSLDGEGSPGDRECDLMLDRGEGGVYDGSFRDSADSAWSFIVPKGRRTIFREGPGQTHNYVGRGPGKVIIYGGDCFVHIDGERVPCAGHVKGNGDHVHPCPIDDDTVVDDGLEIKRYQGIVAYDIEYFGPESQLDLPFRDQADPCAYEFQNR